MGTAALAWVGFILQVWGSAPSASSPWNHAIIEIFMLENTSKIINPTLNPALPSLLLNHVPKCHIYF